MEGGEIATLPEFISQMVYHDFLTFECLGKPSTKSPNFRPYLRASITLFVMGCVEGRSKNLDDSGV